mgnify:CR=1 FL=1
MKLFGCAVAAMIAAPALAGQIGQLTEHRDIGQPASPGTASYDRGTGTYRITAAGRNLWADHDDFHFALKRMSGDVIADTGLDFLTPSPAPDATGFLHRKGGIVLDMRGFNKIVLNEAARSIIVQPGATWPEIQNMLHPRFAVRAMQSTDIFSVGGSISGVPAMRVV